MKNKKSKSILALLATFFINALPILAYTAPISIEGSVTTNDETFYFTPSSDNIYANEPDFDVSEYYFITDTGEQFPIFKNNLVNSPQSPCNHQWVNGTIQHHVSHSDGSCDIVVYNAKQCRLCKTTKLLDSINVIHYVSVG